ncbi:MAG: septal ring lytic transglycosylase RlpA family protein [Neisseria sp.]|nr:septal ring lytic transglycosylase RlpA family protein [Neisseria sp.]
MNWIKNTFFILAVLFVGVMSSLLGTASADSHVQPAVLSAEETPALGNEDIALMPDAVIVPERLHRAANLSYKVKGVRYYPVREIRAFTQEGKASWYGKAFHGRLTTSGERYDMYEMTAAHPTLPIPSYVRVTNLANDKTVIVRINDRGPFHGKRIIDLSYAAAKKLGYVKSGVANVRVEQIVPQQNAAKKAEPTFITVQSFDNLPAAQKSMQRAALHLKQNKVTQRASVMQANGRYHLQVGPFKQEAAAHEIKQNLQQVL